MYILLFIIMFVLVEGESDPESSGFPFGAEDETLEEPMEQWPLPGMPSVQSRELISCSLAYLCLCTILVNLLLAFFTYHSYCRIE
jgi:hypothetical protein